MGFQGAMEAKMEELSGPVLMWSLLFAGVLIILTALFVKNKWYQAAVLAWIVLP